MKTVWFGYGSNAVGEDISSASTLCKDSSDVKDQEGETWEGTKVKPSQPLFT